ncbi:MAG: CPBP family intramembrane metalloprotease [Bacteroidales bacterium]|nr:CPBP family intramembrane metalloprotease [Bacteroidales bacterium]
MLGFPETNEEKPLGIKLFVYFTALLLGIALGGMLTALIGIANPNSMKAGQAISSVLMFVVPPLALYFTTKPEPMRQIGCTRVPNGKLLLAGAAIMFVASPVINQLTFWNEAMHLPAALSEVEKWLRTMEERAAEVTKQMLAADNIGGLLVNIFVMALIPAVGEELTFRAVIQQHLVKACRNAHVGIILSAAIFSAVHFQFYGFLPRMLLGIFLGYFFYTTKSLWVSILMHFLNNASAVVLHYLNNNGVISIDVGHPNDSVHPIILTISIVISILLIVYAWRKREKEA